MPGPESPGRGGWRQATKRDPCPACGKDHWCAWTPDGEMLKCERTTNPPPGMVRVKAAEGGAMFRFEGAASGGPGTPADDARPTPKGSCPAKAYKSAGSAAGVLSRGLGSPSATWTYTDARGEPVGRILRWDTPEGKEIRPVSRHGDWWRIAGMPEPRPLYRLPEVVAAEQVFICEGEKAAEAARSLGLVATTSAHGCQAADKTDWSPLAGKQVVILPDNDESGRQYAHGVAQILAGLSPPAEVRLVALPGLPEGGDMVDYLEQMDSREPEEIREGIEELAAKAPEWTSDSFPAPLREGAPGNESDGAAKGRRTGLVMPLPVPMSALGPSQPPDWVWEGYIARGHTSLLTGLWKAGKTTLLVHLLRDLEAGGGLAGRVGGTRVLMISEESTGLWSCRRDELGIGDHVQVMCRPFTTRTEKLQWLDFTEHVAGMVAQREIGLVVFDTIGTLWPLADENDAIQVLDALLPLNQITQAGAGLLVVHHPRKSDAGEGRATRGSGAFPGHVDVILEFRRFDPSRGDDRRRLIKAFSRFDETPDEQVIELADHGYRVLGSKGDVGREDRLAVIQGLLPAEPPGRTVEEILGDWTDDPKPGERQLRGDLNEGTPGRWVRTGEGKKGDPYRYHRKGGAQ